MSGMKQALLDTIQRGLSDAGSRYMGDRITDSTRSAIRAHAVTFLRGLVDDESIPDDVNLSFVKVTQDQPSMTKLHIELPALLRLYLEDGFDLPKVRRFEHDCSKCMFLAHGLGHDLYFCPIDGLRSTVIARASSEPSDYQSGIPVARQLPITEPLGLAYRIAQEKSHIAGDVG